MDKRTRHALWAFTALCAITAFILITSVLGGTTPEEPPAAENRRE